MPAPSLDGFLIARLQDSLVHQPLGCEDKWRAPRSQPDSEQVRLHQYRTGNLLGRKATRFRPAACAGEGRASGRLRRAGAAAGAGKGGGGRPSLSPPPFPVISRGQPRSLWKQAARRAGSKLAGSRPPRVPGSPGRGIGKRENSEKQPVCNDSAVARKAAHVLGR